jgi:hypothetical protein
MIKNWLLKLLGVDKLQAELRSLKVQLSEHKTYVEQKVHHFTEHTRVDADIGFRGNNTVVLTGIFKGKGFVEFYDIDTREFENLVERMKYLRKEHLIRNIDQPTSFDFKGYFKI